MTSWRSAKRSVAVRASWRRFADSQGIGPEPPISPALLEAFVAIGLTGLRPSTKGTYRSVLRQLGSLEGGRQGAPWAAATARAPYSPAERAELASMAAAQRQPWRRHSALVVLALGIGAGLRSGEIAAATSDDLVRRDDKLALAVAGSDRLVVVREPWAEVLRSGTGGPGSALFHPEPADRSYPNFVNDFCAHLEADPAAPRLSVNRCRSSFLCDHLASGTALAVLLRQSGIKEVESLLRYARHVESAPHSKAALRRALAGPGS